MTETNAPVVTPEQRHETIWLAPWCDGCEKQCYSDEGRTWCQENVYEPCEECGRMPVKYMIAPDQLAQTCAKETNK